jgi:hypothetical protein
MKEEAGIRCFNGRDDSNVQNTKHIQKISSKKMVCALYYFSTSMVAQKQPNFVAQQTTTNLQREGASRLAQGY